MARIYNTLVESIVMMDAKLDIAERDMKMDLQQAKALFSVKSWNENTWDGKPHSEVDGAKLTTALVRFSYSGDMVGECDIRYLMSYCGEGKHGSFVALEHFTGSIGGKAGTFVLQHHGTFDEDGVRAEVSVVPDSATEDLTGLRGSGQLELIGHRESYPFVLEYRFQL